MLRRSYLDANAPQVSVETDTFRKILKACLVDGYGSFFGLGWTLENSSLTTSVFKSKDGVLLLVEEIGGVINLTGCCTSTIGLDYSFPDKHIYKFFPTIYQKPSGLTFNKTDLVTNWTLIGNESYFYFLSNALLVFFGKHESRNTENSYLNICSKSFGSFSDTTLDHSMSHEINNLFIPRFIGKRTLSTKSDNLEISKVYLYDSLSDKILGALPNLFVPDINLNFTEGSFNTTLGKNLLSKIFNGRSILFDINGY